MNILKIILAFVILLLLIIPIYLLGENYYEDDDEENKDALEMDSEHFDRYIRITEKTEDAKKRNLEELQKLIPKHPIDYEVNNEIYERTKNAKLRIEKKTKTVKTNAMKRMDHDLNNFNNKLDKLLRNF